MNKYKAIITIFQCKRTILPHFFIKYIYPQMKAIFPGELKLYLIQHNSKNIIINRDKHEYRLASQLLTNECIDEVKKWTNNGMYDGATIIQHSDVFEKYIHLPSFKRGVEIFLNEEGDFHLWLEDDALVCDTDCDKWPELLKDKDAGLYLDFMPMPAHFIGTPKFEKRIYDIMSDESQWDLSESIWSNYEKTIFNYDAKRIEPILNKLCNSRYILNPTYAHRTFIRNTPPNINLINFMSKINSCATLDLILDLKKMIDRENLIVDWDKIQTDNKELERTCKSFNINL